MYDFERGAKVTGSKFYFNMNALAEFDNIRNMIDYHINNGYQFIIPPYLINKETARQAGILPRFEGDYYETKDEGFILIPTAETPLVGLHSSEIFAEDDLPLRYVAFSPCFRRESGSYGSKDKGLRRVHQFHKIELFVICTPEQSEDQHDLMLFQVTSMLENLYPKIDYRVVELSEKNRSPVSNKTYDIEIKHGDEWLEISSISNTGTNQSDNSHAAIRFRRKDEKKPIVCHLLNGSGVALPRLMLTLEEE